MSEMIAIESKGKVFSFPRGEIKFSKAGKMPCRSWSLQAKTTCPGSKGADGELVDACKGCYADEGNYNYANVAAPRLFNEQDWRTDDWVARMIAELDNDRYFRWLDSGDIAWLSLAEKIYQIMEATPWVKHWLPTRMYKFSKFQPIIAKMQALPNVVVRFSSDSVEGELVEGVTTSTIIPHTQPSKAQIKAGIMPQPLIDIPEGVVMCRSYESEGKCGSCRQCWDKDVAVIGYASHGASMGKNLRVDHDLIVKVA